MRAQIVLAGCCRVLCLLFQRKEDGKTLDTYLHGFRGSGHIFFTQVCDMSRTETDSNCSHNIVLTHLDLGHSCYSPSMDSEFLLILDVSEVANSDIPLCGLPLCPWNHVWKDSRKPLPSTLKYDLTLVLLDVLQPLIILHPHGCL